MSWLKVLNNKEKQDVEKKLNDQFGIKSVPGLIVRSGEERLFLFSGNLSEKEIKNLEAAVPIERAGIYFAKIIREDLKLSIEGSQVLKDQIKKNIFRLTASQAEEWMLGRDLQIKTGKRGFLIMEFNGVFLGCGKASEDKIGNFIPKSRRLKQKS